MDGCGCESGLMYKRGGKSEMWMGTYLRRKLSTCVLKINYFQYWEAIWCQQ